MSESRRSRRSKILAVARFEYLKVVRTKGFVIGIIAMPVFMFGTLLVTKLAEETSDVSDQRFAIVDRTGVLAEVIETAAAARNENVFDDETGEQERPRFLPERAAADDGDVSALRADLSDRVRSGELLGFVELGADLPKLASTGDRTFSWFTNSPTRDALPDWLEGVVSEDIRQSRFAEAEIDRDLVRQLNQGASIASMGLAQRTSTGTVKEAERSNKIEQIAVPAAMAIILFMLVMMSAPALMNTVLEEKMQKIAEVLVASTPPFELLMGKLLGTVGVSLTLALIYVGGAVVFLNVSDVAPPELAAAFGPVEALTFLGFLIASLLIYGSMFSALGSACSELQDAQNLMLPAMLIIMLPIFCVGPVIQDPDGVLARGLSYFPPAAPMMMLIRIFVPPGAAAWEIVLVTVLTLVFTVLCVKAAAKVFRVGLLSHGQPPSYRTLLRWVMSKG